MLTNITHSLAQILINLIEQFGLAAVFLLMTAESALIPIPSEVTMPFAGFLAGRGVFNFWTAVFIGAAGNLLGSILAFWLGWVKGEEWTRYAIAKWGKWLLIRESEFDKAKHWFSKYGQLVTFSSRLLPVVRTFISLPAGIARMNITIFSFYTFVGSFLWSAFLAFLGLKLGQNWMSIEPYFRKFQFLIIGLFILAVILYVKKHLEHRRIK